VEIFRGPNIGEPPYTDPLADEIKGVIGLKTGDKITTDHIMPAGQRLKYRSNIPEYAKYVFENVDSGFAARSLESKKTGTFTAIVGGESYGQGSSREHAAICPMYLGVRLVIAKSFERIHSGNLINFGILPLVFKNRADYDKIEQGLPFVMKNVKKTLSGDLPVTVDIGGVVYEFELLASRRQRDILLAGGLLNYTKNSMA
jgi:aconitate hydratase